MNHTRAQKPTNGHERNFYSRSSARTVPCPGCGSKKAFQPHDDGGGYCHKCEINFPAKSGTRIIESRKQAGRPPEDIDALWDVGRAVLFCWHGYLRRKGGITGFGLKTRRGKLLVPIRLLSGELVSVQKISATGQKKYPRGCQLGDGFFAVGKPGQTIYICEGVATALTIYKVMRQYTVAAMSAGRLLRIAKVIRAAYPNAEITICADNDGD